MRWENKIEEYLLYVGVGIITGFLSGLLGIGGGVVFIPALYLILPVFGMNSTQLPFLITATSLFAGTFASAGGVVTHFKEKNSQLSEGLLLGFGSFVGAVIGPKIILELDPSIPKHVVGILLLIVAAKMLMSKKKFWSKILFDQ